MIKSPAKTYSFIKDGLTQSLFGLYMQCPRKFAIATHGLSKPPKFAMELGSAGHEALDKKGKLGTYKFHKTITIHQREQISAVMKALIPAYLKHYQKEDKVWKFRREYVFDFIYHNVRIRGKMDGIKCNDLGVSELRETKFKSRIGEDGIERALSLDWQSLYYVFAYMQVFKRFPKGGVEYDVIRYPTIKEKSNPKDLYEEVLQGVKDEPEHWFKRWQTRFTENDLVLFIDEFNQKLQEITTREIWFRNECCCTSGYVCDYIDYCTKEDKSALIARELFSELKTKK